MTDDKYVAKLEREVGLFVRKEIIQNMLDEEPELWFNKDLKGFTSSGYEHYVDQLEEIANNYDPSSEPEFVEER